MYLYKKKWFGITFLLATLLFSSLLWIRFYKVENSFNTFPSAQTGTSPEIITQETWKSIFIKDEKSGYAVSKLSQTQTGYQIEEQASFRFNTMGMIQTIEMATRSELKHDFSIESFSVSIHSNLFKFSASGVVSDGVLKINTTGADQVKNQYEIKITAPPYFASGILLDIASRQPASGRQQQYSLFDPMTMEFLPATVFIKDIETITLSGKPAKARPVTISFRNMTQTLWMDSSGQVLLESGMIGMRLEACSREQALSGLILNPAHDITQIAAVKPDKPINHQNSLSELVIELSGFDLSLYPLETDRQSLSNNRLHIKKESLDLPEIALPLPDMSEYLVSGPFIQSDQPKIIDLAHTIVRDEATALGKVKKLVEWVYANINKLPSPSIPDALSTLETRQGDCNEHAVLLAALGRAAGIPTRVETGLYYLRGQFMYHAWNAFFIGKWVTADAVFNQVPADVTHVRISDSAKGTGTELAGIIGNIHINIISAE